MQVGEQHLILAHPAVFLGNRLFHLEDELAGGPDVVGGREDLGTGCHEVGVRDG